MAIFAVSFLPQLVAGKSAAPNEQEIKPTESISIFSVHFTLNLPRASRLLGMTKGRVVVPWKVVAEPKAFSITLGGPQAHDSSGGDDKFAEPSWRELRFRYG
jgi:hypothetical protein